MFGDVKDIAAFREGRRRRHGILHGVATFFIWAFTGPPRGFQLLLSEWRARRAEASSKEAGPGAGTQAAPPAEAVEPAPAPAPVRAATA